MARATVRLPEHRHQRIAQEASREAVSVNAWMVRALHAVVEAAPLSQQQHPHLAERLIAGARQDRLRHERQLPLIDPGSKAGCGISAAVIEGLRLYLETWQTHQSHPEVTVIEVEVNEGPVITTKRFLGRPLLRCEVSDDGRVRSFHVLQTAKGQYAVHICSYPTGKRYQAPTRTHGSRIRPRASPCPAGLSRPRQPGERATRQGSKCRHRRPETAERRQPRHLEPPGLSNGASRRHRDRPFPCDAESADTSNRIHSPGNPEARTQGLLAGELSGALAKSVPGRRFPTAGGDDGTGCR